MNGDSEEEKKLDRWSNGKIVFELFPAEYVALNNELLTGYHPALDFLGAYSMDEVDMKLAQIASYCEVMLDGDYSLENRIQLCVILKERLVLKRVYPVSQSIILS